jgi:hypothetical protein
MKEKIRRVHLNKAGCKLFLKLKHHEISIGVYKFHFITEITKPGRHPLSDAPYLDLNTMLNEQGSGRRILSDALHRCPGVVKNEQGSSHLTRRMRRVRKLAEPSRLRVAT